LVRLHWRPLVAVPGDDPVYGPWFTGHKATAALQRPDFHLYGTAADRAGTTALLEHLRTRLSAPVASEGACL
jgi:flavoprotein hydroxylase